MEAPGQEETPGGPGKWLPVWPVYLWKLPAAVMAGLASYRPLRPFGSTALRPFENDRFLDRRRRLMAGRFVRSLSMNERSRLIAG